MVFSLTRTGNKEFTIVGLISGVARLSKLAGHNLAYFIRILFDCSIRVSRSFIARSTLVYATE